MKIYTKTGIMDIALRPLSEPNPRGDIGFWDKDADILIDITFISDDGAKKWIVTSGPEDPVDIVFHGKSFYFTSDVDAIEREYPKERYDQKDRNERR